MASVKVAVRVRPFDNREVKLDSTCILQVHDNKTRLLDYKVIPNAGGTPRENIKEFTFDYSYWSCKEDDPHYASQEKIFNDLGNDVVESVVQGYNACIFAYGQTGSGKTFTMMGDNRDPGLIPRICEALFKTIEQGRENGITYKVEVTYLEIYNEKVQDLLQPKSEHALRVREHPKFGPYIQNLSSRLVSQISDITELIKFGNIQRATASTNMNSVSSRSHAIFTVHFIQAKLASDIPLETRSKLHLVDLSGSERCATTGNSGVRLKEGAYINRSLVTLGLVIGILAENSLEKFCQKATYVPYRDSILTWLLKESLGGNSKTIMIATVSPANVNYGETLSTLRYASRAKNIVNKPTINEDPNVKLIRELREEIAKLMRMLELPEEEATSGKGSLMATLTEKQAREKVLTDQWTEKWRDIQTILQEQKSLGLRKTGQGVVLDSEGPHLVFIDDDLLSTGIALYHLKDGITTIGSLSSQDIVLQVCEISTQTSFHSSGSNNSCMVILNEPASNKSLSSKSLNYEHQQSTTDQCHKFSSTSDSGNISKSRSLEMICSPIFSDMPNIEKCDLLHQMPFERGALTSTPKKQEATENCSNEEFYVTAVESLDFVSDSKNNGSALLDVDNSSNTVAEVLAHLTFKKPSSNDSFEERVKELKELHNHYETLENDLLQCHKEKNTNLISESDIILNSALLKEERLALLIEREVQRRVFEEFKKWERRGISSLENLNLHSYLLFAIKLLNLKIPCFKTILYWHLILWDLFQVKIVAGLDTWTILRRYRRFRDLYLYMCNKYGQQLKSLYFPPRRLFGNTSEKVVSERRKHLEVYIQDLINLCMKIPSGPLYGKQPSQENLVKLCSFFQKGVFECSRYTTS